MPNINDLTKKLMTLFGRYKYVLLVVAVGILLLLWPSGDGGAKDNGETTAAAVPSTAFSVTELEKKLEEALSSASGVGKARVVLTLKTDMEILLSQDEQVSQHRDMEDGQITSYDYETNTKTVTTAGNAGGSDPIVVGRIYPEFKGALIVCQGAGNKEVQLRVVEAVSALTGLSSDKITVVSMIEIN